MGAILEERKLVYPESDGKPMGETWYHVRAMLELHPVLEDFFRDRPDVFIATDMFSPSFAITLLMYSSTVPESRKPTR